ncbi:hypothetical protein GCM10023196_062770 [Actinoallomurus vinaceus]|uniref:Uncharacterized protein n=1 Tax=Actinoallomurus vinaceus TaxID=1080074 RepID=A0ABP8UJC0_9ACTN
MGIAAEITPHAGAVVSRPQRLLEAAGALGRPRVRSAIFGLDVGGGRTDGDRSPAAAGQGLAMAHTAGGRGPVWTDAHMSLSGMLTLR